jgi:membrane protease YdiL (CAAX protease family)
VIERSLQPSTPSLVALSVILLIYGTFVLAPDGLSGWYVPLNITAAVLLVALARRWGVGWGELGFGHWREGARLGLMVAALLALILTAGVALPLTRGLFDDARLADVGAAGFLYRAVVRIPLGTTLLEEVAFRGVLLAAWGRRLYPAAAAVASSVVFGLWHIRPTLDALATNDLATDAATQFVAVTAAVVGTFVAGLFFCYLRARSRSLLAPVIVHAVVNSASTALAWLFVV